MSLHRQIAQMMRAPAGGGDPLTLTITTTASPQTFRIQCTNVGLFDASIDWGDGESSTITAYNDDALAHEFDTAGEYVIVITEDFPNFYFDGSGANGEDLIDTVSGGVGQPQLSAVRSFRGAGNMTSFSEDIDLSGCIDFSYAWMLCSSLTPFPVVDLSNGVDFSYTWAVCDSLSSFPLVDLSSGSNFNRAWRYCSGLTSFPAVDLSNGTIFSSTWEGCSNMSSFPSGVFDNWVGPPGSSCFYLAWAACSKLTATSVENILNSIATSGVNAPAGTGTQVEITINFNASSGTPDISSAVTTLNANGWTVMLNGVEQ